MEILAPGATVLVVFAAGIAVTHWLNRTAGGHDVQWLGVAIAGLTLACLGGIRFGLVCGFTRGGNRAAELALCIAAVLVAIAALELPPLASICVLIASYLIFALRDVLSVERRLLPQWFGLLRVWFTTGVVLSLLAMLATSLI